MAHRKNLKRLKRIIDGKLNKIIKGNSNLARIAIVYHLGQYQIFPPILATLNHDDIEEFDPIDDFYESIWNPAEFPDYATPGLSLEEEKKEGVFQRLNEEHKKKPLIENDAIDIYIECSASAILFSRSIGRDVIVFCTDPELSHLKKNVEKIKKSINDLNVIFPSWLN